MTAQCASFPSSGFWITLDQAPRRYTFSSNSESYTSLGLVSEFGQQVQVTTHLTLPSRTVAMHEVAMQDRLQTNRGSKQAYKDSQSDRRGGAHT